MMMQVFGQPKVLDIVAPLENNGKLFATVHVGVHTSLLRAVYEPLLEKGVLADGLCPDCGVAGGFFAEQPGAAAHDGDQPAARPPDVRPEERQLKSKAPKKQDVAAQVSTKIEKIGQRMRNVEEIYSALRENLDQILGNLQDGIMLFTEDRRAVLVSEAARRFLQIDRDNILGLQAREIFDDSKPAGTDTARGYRIRQRMEKEEIRTENGRRIQASVDFIYDDETHRGWALW
jgi:PAS domain-containing protein